VILDSINLNTNLTLSYEVSETGILLIISLKFQILVEESGTIKISN
jgi:hypothetical protein